jgi:hypothetical protein
MFWRGEPIITVSLITNLDSQAARIENFHIIREEHFSNILTAPSKIPYTKFSQERKIYQAPEL